MLLLQREKKTGSFGVSLLRNKCGESMADDDNDDNDGGEAEPLSHWAEAGVYIVGHVAVLLVSYLTLQTWLSYGPSECPARPV